MKSQLENSAASHEVNQKDNVHLRPGYFLIVTLVIVFVAEAFVMFILSQFPNLSLLTEALADAALLSVLTFPFLYIILFRPLCILVHDYEKALLEVKTLRGLLPICMKCKKILLPDSDEYDQNSWQNIETYIEHNSETEFSHGLCPQCYKVWRKEMGLKEEDN